MTLNVLDWDCSTRGEGQEGDAGPRKEGIMDRQGLSMGKRTLYCLVQLLPRTG